MLRATGFGSPIRARSSRWSGPRQPKTSFRTSPIRLAAILAVAGLVLANMIVAYRLLGEQDSSVAVVLGKAEQHGEGSAFERIRDALDNLSRDEIGAPILLNGDTSKAPPSYMAQELSTPLTVSKSVVAGSDSSSNSSGSGSTGSGHDDEGDHDEGDGDDRDDRDDEGDHDEGDHDERDHESDHDEGATISPSARAAD